MHADYFITLGEGDNCKSGPIVKDLAVPIFNDARRLLLKTNELLRASEDIPNSL